LIGLLLVVPALATQWLCVQNWGQLSHSPRSQSWPVVKAVPRNTAYGGSAAERGLEMAP